MIVRQLPDGFKALPLSKVNAKIVDDLYRFLAKETGRKPATRVAVSRRTAGRIRPPMTGAASVAAAPCPTLRAY